MLVCDSYISDLSKIQLNYPFSCISKLWSLLPFYKRHFALGLKSIIKYEIWKKSHQVLKRQKYQMIISYVQGILRKKYK